eukprot:12389803-Alexandrium_andersonii.AAC.1
MARPRHIAGRNQNFEIYQNNKMTARQKRIVATHILGNAYKVCLPVVCVLSDAMHDGTLLRHV